MKVLLSIVSVALVAFSSAALPQETPTVEEISRAVQETLEQIERQPEAFQIEETEEFAFVLKRPSPYAASASGLIGFCTALAS